MKKVFCVLGLSVALWGVSMQPAFAEEWQGIVVNGEPINMEQYDVFTNEDQVIVPLRPTAEALGFQVVWDSETNTILLDDQSVKTQLTIGQDAYYKQSSQMIGLTQAMALNYAPTIINDRVYVPLKLYDLLLSNQATRVEDAVVYIESGQKTALPNPIATYQTLQEAQAAGGFEFKVPALPAGYEEERILLIAGDTISIEYVKDDQSIHFRASQRDGDISGVYDEYDYTDTLENAQIKGNGQMVHVALLSHEGVTYSLYSEKGFAQAEVAEMLRSLQ